MEVRVVLLRDSPYSDYGYYRTGDTGVLVGFTRTCAVVIRDKDGRFVLIEPNYLKKLEEE